MHNNDLHKGACLCGQISFSLSGPLPPPNACHCNQCRKQSGHYWASVDVKESDVTIQGDVSWFQSSEKVRRGFCGTCGSFLFWNPIHHDTIALAMGAFDTPSQTKLGMHIFVANKGDYYDIADGLPQNLQ